jgi:type III restriction enzyme
LGRWAKTPIFFVALPDGTIAADIVDPHSHHLSDALPKLQGLAHYAETYGSAFRRIESVAKLGNTLRTLDLTEPAIRQAILEATDVKSLYEGPLANNL